MGSLFEIHRSNLEWLKSYVYPDGFKLDSDRYQIGVSFELCHEHFEREEDGTVSLYSHTPSFCEKVPFSNICDYFRKPVYRRSAHV